MKKIFIVSGLLIITMIIMIITGIVGFDNSVKAALAYGNQLFDDNNYEGALRAYQKGLQKRAQDFKLNYNSGQVSYILGDYQQAVEFYKKSDDNLHKYLNSGNSSLKLGDTVDDENQKLIYYQQALETYKKGIIKFPENVALKYNYEYVKEKIEKQQDREENQQNNEDNKDKQEENQDNQDKDNEQNENSQENEQSDDSGKEDNQQQKQEDSQDEQSEHNKEQDEAQNEESSEKQDEQQNSSSMNKSDSQEAEQNDREIAQVLEMLEKQEEDSLKNNQQVKTHGKEDKYDW